MLLKQQFDEPWVEHTCSKIGWLQEFERRESVLACIYCRMRYYEVLFNWLVGGREGVRGIWRGSDAPSEIYRTFAKRDKILRIHDKRDSNPLFLSYV